MIYLSIFEFIAKWVPVFLGSSIFILFILLYRRRKKWTEEEFSRKVFLFGLLALSLKIVYAIFLTIVQYIIWNSNPLTKILINMPYFRSSPSNFIPGYYFFYAFSHYWLNLLLSLFFGLVFLLFLRALKKYRQRFFDSGETEMGGFLAFLTSWPNNLLFVAISFLLVVVISLFKFVRQKESLTTLGLPFMISAGLVLLWGGYFVATAGLSVLII